MKKLFFLLSFAFLATFVQAQVTPQSRDIYDRELFATVYGDTLVDTTETILLWRNYTNKPNTAAWRVNWNDLDSANLTIYLQESPLTNPEDVYPSTDWKTIATFTWTADEDTILYRTMTYGRRGRMVCATFGTGTTSSLLKPLFEIKPQIGSKY